MSERDRAPTPDREAEESTHRGEKAHVFDDPRNTRRLLRGLYTACALLFLVDFVFPRHGVHPVERLWGFYAIYGWLACVTLVLLAKRLRRLLMRSEDYYDAD